MLFRKFLGIWTLFLLAGCVSNNIEAIMSEPVFFKAADLKITLTHIPPEVLRKRHGRNTSSGTKNPYLDFPSISTPKRIVAFHFQAETASSEIQFTLNEIRLNMDRVEGAAVSSDYLMKIWEVYTDEYGKSDMRSTLKRTLLKDQFTVSPEKPADAYLAFAENYSPEGGDSIMSFKVTASDGSAGFLEIPFYFGDAKAETEANTGIFAQD